MTNQVKVSEFEIPEIVEVITWISDLQCNGCKCVNLEDDDSIAA